MGYYWIGFTLIWIIFYQKETISAASLRGESLDFSPDAIGNTKSLTEQNVPVENSNYYQKSNGNLKHRARLPYERRNRQIYTSKTFFGRNQQFELPKYGINKEGTGTAPLRRKSARYMYPEEPRQLSPEEYGNSALNYEHVIPYPSQQIPAVPEHNMGYGVHGLNYNPNLGNADRREYGLNRENNPSVGYEQNSQYNGNVKYDPLSDQNANVGFDQVPTYQDNAGYQEHYAHGQDSEPNRNFGYGQKSVYDNAGIAQDLRYVPNFGQEHVLKYDPTVRQGQDLGFDPNVRQEHVSGYDPNVRQGHDLRYDRNVQQQHVLTYDPNVRQGQDLVYNTNLGNGQDFGHGINAGNIQNPGYDSNVRNRQDPRYGNVIHGQETVYVNHVQQGQDHGYNVGAGNIQDHGYSEVRHEQDPGFVNHAEQDHGYKAMTEHRQNYGYPNNPKYGHGSVQNYVGSKRPNGNAGYGSKIEYGAKNYGLGVTSDESKEIVRENVDSKFEVFKHKDDKKDVLQKEAEKQAIDHTVKHKESNENKEHKNILNNEDHIKILNMYNRLLLSEKQKDHHLNENTKTTSAAPNNNFISDENLEKDELLRHLPEENTFKQLHSDSVGNELKVTKSTFLEELEGSGDIESVNEHLPISDQESNKSPRILDIFSRANESNQCLTPKNESGHCLGLTQCPLIETTENFSTFLQYMCFQQSRLVGICCPDNPVIEITDPLDKNSTKQEKVDIQQPSEGCGLSTNTRIVGGTMSIPHEFSWMVALLRRGRFYCGGVIINNWYILTAAHCVLGIKVGDLKVRLGEFDFHKTTDHQRDIPVSEIKRHALFVTLTFQHDIAVLKLKRKIEYTKFIGSICLPNKDEGDFTARNATVVGWGTVSFGGAASPILRKVTVPVWDNKQCDRTYVFERINEAFMCAGSPENGEDACQGDSGGPLMTMNEDGRWSVIGIVSWGRRCGDPTYPGVYTRVTSYLDWIAENAQ